MAQGAALGRTAPTTAYIWTTASSLPALAASRSAAKEETGREDCTTGCLSQRRSLRREQPLLPSPTALQVRAVPRLAVLELRSKPLSPRQALSPSRTALEEQGERAITGFPSALR